MVPSVSLIGRARRAVSRAGDLLPAQHERRIGEAGAREGGRARRATASRPTASAQLRRWAVRSGCLSLGVCAMVRVCPSARTPKQKRTPTRAAQLLAWYDVHRRELPWRARRGRSGRSLSRVAVGDHAAADDRAGGRRATTVKFLKRWPTVKALAARRRTTCSRRGRGSATTRARATCTRRRRSWRTNWADAFRDTPKSCARCPASATTRPARSPRSRSTGREAAMDANAERVIARLFAVEEPLPKAKPRIARRLDNRWCRRSAPAISRRR